MGHGVDSDDGEEDGIKWGVLDGESFVHKLLHVPTTCHLFGSYAEENNSEEINVAIYSYAGEE